jgi:hypothetical protein
LPISELCIDRYLRRPSRALPRPPSGLCTIDRW